MNRMAIAKAVFDMAKVMESSTPTVRAYIQVIDENGDLDEEEVPIGAKGATEYAWVEVSRLVENGRLQWSLCDQAERFEALRARAVAGVRKIAEKMVRGKTFLEAKEETESERHLWCGYLPTGSSSGQPWWSI